VKEELAAAAAAAGGAMAMVRLYGGYAVHVHMLAGRGQCDIYVVEMDWFTVAAPSIRWALGSFVFMNFQYGVVKTA